MHIQNGEKYSTKDKQKVKLSSYAFRVIDSDYEYFGSQEVIGAFKIQYPSVVSLNQKQI